MTLPLCPAAHFTLTCLLNVENNRLCKIYSAPNTTYMNLTHSGLLYPGPPNYPAAPLTHSPPALRSGSRRYFLINLYRRPRSARVASYISQTVALIGLGPRQDSGGKRDIKKLQTPLSSMISTPSLPFCIQKE